MAKDLLFIPDITSGSGHLIRAIRLRARLGGKILLYSPPQEPHSKNAYRPAIAPEHLARMYSYISLLEPGMTISCDVAIFDYRSLAISVFERIRAGLSIGLDLGGDARMQATYLIDTLPNFLSKANITDYGFLEPAKEIRKDWPQSIKSVLIVFGGSDHGNRAKTLAQALRKTSNLTVHAHSGIFTSSDLPRNKDYFEKVLISGENFRNTLKDYDLVITHAGMLAFEALWSKVAVLMVNPESYHERLCQLAELPYIAGTVSGSFGFKKKGVEEKQLANCILKYIEQEDIISRCKSIRPDKSHNLAEFLQKCIQHHQGGELRNAAQDVLLARFPLDSYFYSKRWDVGYLETVREQKIEYSEDYFFQEYKSQYGKTYVEDAAHIRELSAKRLEHIRAQKPVSYELLDIGCAYGFFMQEAQKRGFTVKGIDISSKAVEYVRVELGLVACCHDVQKSDIIPEFRGELFGVVCMWYVLEHCSDVLGLLALLRKIMLPGAILALALPNASGISARRNKMKFLQESPIDHYHLFSHAKVKKLFRAAGFQLCKKVNTGHHPERFPFALPWLQPLFLQLSRLFSLGDTFEAYFRYTGRKE